MVAIPFGSFVLEKPIGQGGMGEVWKGRHLAQNEPVAVKIMHRETLRTPEYVASFRNEVRHVAALNHPGVVVVFDYGEVPVEAEQVSGGHIVAGSPYIVMEYAKKGSLIDLAVYLGWPELRHVLLVLLDALAHAHARDVIHRDLKPENVLVGCGDSESIKLTDFGLAHAADRFLNSGKVEPVWGTPQYMAPEQLRGLWRDYGPWTDLYSLGCMTYQLVCGKFPYTGSSVWDIGKAHLISPIPQLEPKMAVPPGLDEWIVRLMQKDRRHRFQTAADAAWALRQLGGGSYDPTMSLARSVASTPSKLEESAETEMAPTVLLDEVAEAPTIATPTRTVDLHQWFETEVASPAETLEGGLVPIVRTAEGVVRPPVPLTWRTQASRETTAHLFGAGLGLYGLRAVPFVDRIPERDRIWQMLREVCESGRSNGFLITGAAGVGKSELARWMSRRADELGVARVLRATHSRVEVPSDGLEAMLSRFLRCTRLGRDDVERRLTEKFKHVGFGDAYTVQAVTELVSPRHAGTSGSESPSGTLRFANPRQRYAVLYTALQWFARERPLILVLDDVQWGASALGFVHYVLEQQESQPAPMLLLMTLRDDERDERFEESVLLRQLEELHRVERCDLGPLGAEDTGELVERLLGLDDEVTAHVKRRSQGIPLFAVQLIGDWVSRGKLILGSRGFSLAPGEALEIPDDLHSLWVERLVRVLDNHGEEALFAVEIAAALGLKVDSREWREACRFGGGHATERIVEDLVKSGLAQSVETGWAFSHGMLRESVIRSSREHGRWDRFNAACAHMLYHLYSPRQYGVAERHGWHMIEAGWPREALQPFLVAVDGLIERSDLGRAHRLLNEREDIFGHLGDEADPSDECEGWIRRATLYEYEGRYTEALQLAAQAARLAQHHHWAQLLAPSLLCQGNAECHLGRLDLAEQNFESSARLFCEHHDAAGHGRCLVGLGRVAEQRGDFARAVDMFEAARDIFEREGDMFGVAQCLNALGDIARQGGDLTLARSYSQQAHDICSRIQYTIGIADSLNDLSEIDRLRGDLDGAREKGLQSLALYQALGSKKSLFVELNLALIQLVEGRLPEAAVLYESLELALRRTQQWSLLPQALMGLMAGYVAEENWQAFDWCHEEILRLLEQTGVASSNLAIATEIVAELAVKAGQQDRAAVLRRLMRRQLDTIRTRLGLGRLVVDHD
jgi:eukaryotic-like serine/threonine-protein kinase